MAKPIEVNEGNFEQVVLKSATPVLVDFWATWCHPCQMIGPILEELTGEYGGQLTITKLNVDENQSVASKYHVMSIPTMILFKGGKPASTIVGFKPKNQLKKEIDSALSK